MTTDNVVARFIHLGAGLQSSALVEMVIEGELPPVTGVVFSDTGNEPYWVYETLEYLSERLKQHANKTGQHVPLHVVGRGRDIAKEALDPNGRFIGLPLHLVNAEGKKGQSRRQCTSEYKIKPLKNFILSWLDQHGYTNNVEEHNGRIQRRVRRGVVIESWFGITFDETERMSSSGSAWQQFVYPFIDRRMKRHDCASWLQANNLPVPRKSSCIICPYHSNDYWILLKRDEPELFESASRFDDAMRSPRMVAKSKLKVPAYLHRSCLPLRDVDLSDPDNYYAGDVCGADCHV